MFIKLSRNNKNWSKEEVEFLIEHYQTCSCAHIADKLNRSIKSVQRKAFKLGIANKTPKVDIKLIKKEFLKAGYSVISKEYRNSRTKLKFKCNKGHIAELTWNKFQNGRRCPRCYYNPKDMYDKILTAFSSAGYKLLLLKEEYIDSKQKLLFICPNGHKYSMCWNSFDQGQRCSKCNPNISGAEKEVCSFVKSLGFTVIENSKSILGDLELDIYIPSKKLAIEYCGLRWHGENFPGKPRNHHYLKYKKCFDLGIRLITIFEDEYLERPEVVLSRIKNALGAISITIPARKTKFKIISNAEAKKFLNRYHLQGYSPCRYRYGLFFKDELVQVITFGYVSRKHAGSKNVIELKRLASVSNAVVVGGVQKLFKRSVSQWKHEYDTVKSYCDMRWANPFKPVYEKLGFELSAETKYTPHYLKSQKRYRNQTLRKTPEERKTGMSEWELRKKQGYDRIWDCGHRTYVYEIKGGV